MINVNSIQIADLQDADRFHEFQKAVVEAVETGHASDVLDFRIRMQDFFREYADLEVEKPELFRNYRKIILYIELEEFEFLTEDLQCTLIQKYFDSFAQLRLDICHKVDLALLLEDDLLRDDKRDTFMAALLQNQTYIGSENIEVEGVAVSPTIGNWTKKYRFKFGFRHQSDMIRMDFCSRDDARTLSERDQGRLRLLVDLIEQLKVEPQREEETEQQPVPAARVENFSPLYVPIKKPKVPLSQVPKLNQMASDIQPRTTLQSSYSGMPKTAVRPNYGEAPADQQPSAQVTSSGVAFRSLADLHSLDLPFVQNLGENFASFIAMVKTEVQKVYTRSPESKPPIIELWRQSPLFMLYNEMSEESMQTRQPISAIAEQRNKNGQPTLTKEQFNFVADLSKTIQ